MFSSLITDDHAVIAIYSNYRVLLTEPFVVWFTENLACLHCGSLITAYFERCSCNATLPHPLLALLHEQSFGKSADFIGLYRCKADHWEAMHRKISRRVRDAIRQRRPDLKRVLSQNSVQDVESWIDANYPDSSLSVNLLSIPTDTREAKAKYGEIYARCFRHSETNAHGYLKWIALNWLTQGQLTALDNSILMGGVELEALYLLPGHRVSKVWTGGKGRIIPNEWRTQAFHPQEIIKFADVYSGSSSCVVECGETSVDSLVLPILARIAKRVVWIPYLEIQKDQIDFGSVSSLTAFSIQRVASRRA